MSVALRKMLKDMYALYSKELYHPIVDKIITEYDLKHDEYLDMLIDLAIHMKKNNINFFDLDTDEIHRALNKDYRVQLYYYDIVLDFPFSELLIDYFFKRIDDKKFKI